ncbi:prepilin-type cleavage/methylation protein [Enterococcus faecium]|nr:prepilin-type cleavage/methylation protein [Enterococcus faecium]
MQTSTSDLEGKTLASGYTLFESLLLILLLTTILSFPVLAFSAWKNELAVYQFFSQFEKRIYTTQKIAIVNQIQTGFYWNNDENQIIFRMSQPDEASWKVLDIPDEITLKRHASITFAAGTGNESSLKAYQFYWEEKGKRLRINSRWGVDAIQKELNRKGFILLESLTALMIASVCVYLVSFGQLFLLQAEKNSGEEMLLIRMVYEDTKTQRIYHKRPERSEEMIMYDIQIIENNGVIEKVLVNMEKEAINIEKTRNPGIYAD